MNEILGFLHGRLDAWVGLMSTPRMQCVIAFLLFLLAADIARRGWRLSWSRRAVQGVFTTLTIFHLNLLFVPFIVLGSNGIEALYGLTGIPSIPTDVWTGVPVWLLAPFAVLAHDFATYWNHRLLHTKWFWPVHAIHHSDPDVNGLTTYRIHILEGLVMWGSYIIMLTWLGLPGDAIGFGAVLLALHNMYVHVDVDWDHGRFRLLVASPRFHRWHHADVPEAYGKNLANVFPFYDRIFGTYYVPGTCTAPLGAEGVPQNDVVKLVLWPFLEWPRLASAELSAFRARRSARRVDAAPAAGIGQRRGEAETA